MVVASPVCAVHRAARPSAAAGTRAKLVKHAPVGALNRVLRRAESAAAPDSWPEPVDGSAATRHFTPAAGWPARDGNNETGGETVWRLPEQIPCHLLLSLTVSSLCDVDMELDTGAER